MAKIVLLHGALGSARDLKSLERSLTLKNHEVLTLSFQGHDKTTSTDFSIKGFADQLAGAINNFGKDAVVFGYSMGGFVALHLASAGFQINTLITLSTRFNWSSEYAESESKKLDADQIKEKHPGLFNALDEAHGDATTILQKTSDVLLELPSLAKDLLGKLPALEIPVWLGTGDTDRMVSIAETMDVLSQLKSGSLFVLPKTKHAIQTADPDILAEIISAAAAQERANVK
jgi:pimeloyl-ACP methyl ester carboxylesterase